MTFGLPQAEAALAGASSGLVVLPFAQICQETGKEQEVQVHYDEGLAGSVLDVEMTILDKQSKGVPIDEQANDDVVHLDRFREADRLADQAFDPCA